MWISVSCEAIDESFAPSSSFSGKMVVSTLITGLLGLREFSSMQQAWYWMSWGVSPIVLVFLCTIFAWLCIWEDFELDGDSYGNHQAHYLPAGQSNER
jgi:hypothetical protein